MTKILNQIMKYKKVSVWTLLVLNIVMAGSYMYAVNRTVFNVVASTKAEKSLKQESAKVADLESKYVSLKNKINLQFAYAQGFADASNQQLFVVKKASSNTLSFNAL